MQELKDLVWVEKYRPSTLDDLICEHKDIILKAIEKPLEMPSFILESSRPGTGKTTTARIISKLLDCDMLKINASDERGIDVIRDKIRMFAQSISFNPSVKRCVFLDEADGLTTQAQESMKSLMELYSDNCFFIMSCNNVSKIIEPIRKGRCVVLNFSRPDKSLILKKLEYICKQEKLEINRDALSDLITCQYPDIRSMISELQKAKLDNRTEIVAVSLFNATMKAIKEKNVKYIYEVVYSGDLDVTVFNRYYFEKIFEHSDKADFTKLAKMSQILADTEKHINIGNNIQIIFIANLMRIMELL